MQRNWLTANTDEFNEGNYGFDEISFAGVITVIEVPEIALTWSVLAAKHGPLEVRVGQRSLTESENKVFFFDPRQSFGTVCRELDDRGTIG